MAHVLTPEWSESASRTQEPFSTARNQPMRILWPFRDSRLLSAVENVDKPLDDRAGGLVLFERVASMAASPFNYDDHRLGYFTADRERLGCLMQTHPRSSKAHPRIGGIIAFVCSLSEALGLTHPTPRGGAG